MPESTLSPAPVSNEQLSSLLYEWMDHTSLLRKVVKTDGRGAGICNCCGSFNRPCPTTTPSGINWTWSEFHPRIKTINKDNGVIIPDKEGSLILSWNGG